MSKRMIYLTSFILAQGLVGTSAAQNVDPSLVGWWKLDDGSGTTVFDSSGNGNHGTINNAAGGGLGNNGSVWVNDPERGMVISFNGADGADSGAVVITDLIIPAMTMDNDFTWAFWAFQHADQATNNDLILGNRYGGTESPLQFIKFTPTRFEFYNVDGSYTEGINYEPIPGDVWVHHVIVKDGTSLTYYRNGEVAGTNTISKTIDENPFYMGGDIAAEHWQGYLSDVRLYTKALSVAEVLGVMQGSGEVWLYASEPTPDDGAMHGDTRVNLSWRAGDTAVSHDIYFGESFDDVDDGTGDTFQGNQTRTNFTVGVTGFPYPDGLVLDTTYYWRIDEVEADGTTIHKGDVWSFTVSFMSAEEDFESNNFSTFPWEHDGDASWTIISYEKHSGTYSAQAGAIDHDESSTLRVLLDCTSGDITFYRKVSSESGCDYLEFYIDGVREGRWSSTMDWDQVSFPVRAGTRIFEWTYSKDGSISSDWDTAWIDDIVFPIGTDTIPTGEVIELTDAAFDQTVLRSDIPVLVDFWAPWCGPCLVMAPVIEEIADEYAGKVKVCKLNVDNAPQTTTNYGIRFIPTFILFKDGQVQRRWVGVTSKNEITAAIDELL